MALEKYTNKEIPTSTKFNLMVDAVNSNTSAIAQIPSDLVDSTKGTEGQVLTRTASGGAEWKDAQGGSSSDGETVRIVLTTSVEGVSVANKSIYLYLNDTTTNPEVLTTDANGMVAKKIPTDYKYRLTFPDIDGCDSIPDVVHTAVLRERSIEIEYKAVATDKEVVTIKCKKYEQNVSNVYSGKVVKVVIGSQTAEYTADSNGKVEIEVATGTTYTVKVDTETDYYISGGASHTYTAGKSSRNIYFDFHNMGVGLFLVDNNGKDYTYDEWVASGNEGSQAVAIKIATSQLVTNNGVYYILLDDVVNKAYASTKQWSSQNVQFNNIPLNGNSGSAEYYYNGKGATDAIVDEGINRGISTPAATFAKSKTTSFDNGQVLNGFLYSVGQDRAIASNITPLNAMFSLVRPSSSNTFSTMLKTGKWTSTQGNANGAYYVDASVNGISKTVTNGVLVVYA